MGSEPHIHDEKFECTTATRLQKSTKTWRSVLDLSWLVAPLWSSSYDELQSFFFQQESFDAPSDKPHNMFRIGWTKSISQFDCSTKMQRERVRDAIGTTILFDSCQDPPPYLPIGAPVCLSLSKSIKWWTLLSCYIDQQFSGNHPDSTVMEKENEGQIYLGKDDQSLDSSKICSSRW